jgi:hypothetical protein
MEYFFKRLGNYLEVRPTPAMTDIIVKIMVEVLSILGIVTKEVEQGRISMCFLVDMSQKINIIQNSISRRLLGGMMLRMRSCDLTN